MDFALHLFIVLVSFIIAISGVVILFSGDLVIGFLLGISGTCLCFRSVLN